ncbi:MAG TPA: hypothetical protein VJ901_16320 [Thermoanaerobaculia bacterium]|nr:hypothetical protein [Thermoanaerobaculia bacterium]
MAIQATAQSSNQFNVHYLDSVNGNFLFRGAMPIANGALDYKDLVANLQAVANAHKPKVTLPKSFYIADISLVQLQNSGDTNELQTEYAYWAGNKNQGRFVYWETDGYVIDPSCPQLFAPAAPKGYRDYLARTADTWLPDKLTARIDQLHAWLMNGMPNETKLPVVLFVHCDGGCDRTGEVSGAYAMKYLKQSWHQINTMNFGDCGGHAFGCGNFITAHWYCFWLQETTGRKDLGCDSKESCNGTPQPSIACPPQPFGT